MLAPASLFRLRPLGNATRVCAALALAVVCLGSGVFVRAAALAESDVQMIALQPIDLLSWRYDPADCDDTRYQPSPGPVSDENLGPSCRRTWVPMHCESTPVPARHVHALGRLPGLHRRGGNRHPLNRTWNDQHHQVFSIPCFGHLRCSGVPHLGSRDDVAHPA